MPSPYQRTTLQLSAAEYYRRLLIAIARKQNGTLAISGSDLLAVTAQDGLFLRFNPEGLTLTVADAADNWEAHVGTPGPKEPESWTVRERPHLVEAAQPATSASTIDNQRVAELEAKQAKRRAAAKILEGSDATSSGTAARVAWYEGDAPRQREQ